MLKEKLICLVVCMLGMVLFTTHAIASGVMTAKKVNDVKVEPPPIGNLALPTSNQPGSLFGFGQNVIDKGKRQLLFSVGYTQGPNSFEALLLNSFIYAFTDATSIDLVLPVTIRAQEKRNRSSGIGDFLIQFEHAFYHKDTFEYTDEATIVLSLFTPTGSIDKNPATGSGTYAIFTGFTFVRMCVDWLFYFSPGVNWTIAHQGTKTGNAFLYQSGLGKNICYEKDKYIFNWLVEVIGTYIQKNRIRGSIDPNSGGNLIFVAPSIWYSNKSFQFQIGVGIPVSQRTFGNETPTNYLALTTFGWTF